MRGGRLSELLAQAQAGDQQALNALLEELRPLVCEIARGRLGPELKARVSVSDIVQEVLVQVTQQVPQLKVQNSEQLLAWLVQVTSGWVAKTYRFHCAQKRDIRREAALEAAQGAVSDPVPPVRAEQLEAWNRTMAALQQLPEDMQEVIRLRVLDGLRWQEIALQLNRSDQAARALFGRAMKRLRAILDSVQDSRDPGA